MKKTGISALAKRTTPTLPSAPQKVRGLQRRNDINMGWVAREFPQFETWRQLAIDWIKGETRGRDRRLNSLSIFFEQYLSKRSVPLDPARFLARTTTIPDFYASCNPKSKTGISQNNCIHEFLDFVLKTRFSAVDDFGRAVILPTFHNPIEKRSRSEFTGYDESVRSPLPIGYIDELRRMLAQGPHFRDWTWAQGALGRHVHSSKGGIATDWFTVTEDKIDRADPDCVWRERQRKKENGGRVLELWSPVRWVGILIKLILPLRTHQVRMLDSGEADTWCFGLSIDGASGTWKLNTQRLAQGSVRRPLQVGVFHRCVDVGNKELTELYINTNKTSDSRRSGQKKGYTMPWQMGGSMHTNPYYWLVKLRNWQSKYNAVTRRTKWSALDGRHTTVLSDVQTADLPDACFLFRRPDIRGGTNLPLGIQAMDPAWYALLESMEERFKNRGETHADGSPIRLVHPKKNIQENDVTYFPLHSLRVSLITALAIDGQMPIHILQKLVGHSRLIMTIYYCKPGASHIRHELADASRRLEERKDSSIVTFLRDASHKRLVQQAIANSSDSLAAAIPEHPGNRNPAGWQFLHHGLCLVGGNTSSIEGNSSLGGCHNGGPKSPGKLGAHDPVPGGVRNCVRCRWFVTEPHYLPAQVAHWNTLSYHLWEAMDACRRHDAERQLLFTEQAVAGESGLPFTHLAELRQAERVWEAAMQRASGLVEDLAATWRLIDRCQQALREQQGKGQTLIAAGTATDVEIAFQETHSELRQISGVCQNVEVYPDLDPGKAIIRQSQLLDAALQSDKQKPIFLRMSEQDQFRAGNAFMRKLAQQVDQADPARGMRTVIDLIDAGKSLREYLGFDLSSQLQESRPKPIKLKLTKKES